MYLTIDINEALLTIDKEVRTVSYSIINSTTWKYCSIAFIWIAALLVFVYKQKQQNSVVQHNKLHRKNVLMAIFHYNHLAQL